MNKLLIIYSETEVITVSNHTQGTVVVTPHQYLVETKSKALLMLNALEVDATKLKNYVEEDFELEEIV